MTGNQVSIYNSIKSNLYNQLVLINNFKSTGSLDMIELLNSTSVSNNSKLIITEVIEAIQSEPNIINNEGGFTNYRSEEHTSELQSRENLVCRLLLEKKKKNKNN